MKHWFLTVFIFPFALYAAAQTRADTLYEGAFQMITDMLDGGRPASVEHAVFAVENAYMDGQMDSAEFSGTIEGLSIIARAWAASNPLVGYDAADSSTFAMNRAVYHVMMDTTFMAPGVPLSLPMVYDTADFFGNDHWESTFVSKLLATGVGNCHGLPLLYTMLCQRMGSKAYLAFAPNHIYIKQYSKKYGWYNTELTSGQFPDDAWIMASGYISADAIRSGLYMDTLGIRQVLGLCLTDLAMGYQRRTGYAQEAFTLKCCNAALQAHPLSSPALHLKTEALTRLTDQDLSEEERKASMDQLTTTVAQLVAADYRQVPAEVYRQWMAELRSAKGRFEYVPRKMGE